MNVVVITLDTVRAANMSLYGYGRPTTPVLERIARSGTVFDSAFTTAPWTLPSHASMFTGRWPHELSVDYDVPLDGQYPTLADTFTARGYATAGFAANLGYVSDESGLGRGFQHYEDYPRSLGQMASSSTLVRTVADNFRFRRLIRNDEHLNRVPASELNRRASDWLDAHGNTPFLLFLNYFDAHEPYLPPVPFDRQFGPGRAEGKHSPLHHWLWNPAVGHGNMDESARREEQDAYDGALAALDQDVGAFVADLDRRGLTDRTVLVITADHGEEFGEHGVYDHGYSLYGVSLHVPLVIVAPTAAPAARRISTPVSLRDLPATLCELTGCAPSAFPGSSLSAHWRDTPAVPPATSPVFFEVRPSAGQPDWFPSSKGPMVGAVIGQWHYIRNGDAREELYDWRADPFEQRDRAAQPEARDALIAARALVAEVSAARTRTP
jgi:arylsulfatase A-like enzyme